MRVLIIAATRHDSTREIAEAIGAGLAKRGIDTETRPIDEVTDLAGYDAVVLGSAVYMGRWLKPARQFAERNRTALAAVPLWLFSSGPLGSSDRPVPSGEPVEITKLMTSTGAREHRVFSGRLKRERLGFAERAAAKAAHAPEVDSRDWPAIDGFAGKIAAQLGGLTYTEAGTRETIMNPVA